MRRLLEIGGLLVVQLLASPPFAQGVLFTRESTTEGSIVIRTDVGALRRAAAKGGRIQVDRFPLAGETEVDLELEELCVVSRETRFVLGTDAGDRRVDVDPSRFLILRGSVIGRVGSHVFLSVGAGFSGGRIELGSGAATYALAPAPEMRAGELIVFEDRSRSAPLLCGREEWGQAPARSSTPVHSGSDPIRGQRLARLAVDGDHELYSLFDSEQDAIDYLVQTYARVSDITLRDTRTRLELIFVRVWTTPNDPYGEEVSLPIFGSSVGYDLAQLLSGRKDAAVGGVGQLCGPRSWVAYSLGSFTDPGRPNGFNQDIRIAAHELGHNLGASHTHTLGVDECDTPGSPPRRGTLMSYCSQTHSGGSSVTDLRYHTVCQAEIFDCLSDAKNYVFDCNENRVDDALDIADGISKDTNANEIPDECEDCNGNGVLDSDDIAIGYSSDANGNGVPDECEPDCNANGIPDDVDIRLGISVDLYGNGIPDQCEEDCNANGVSDYNEIQADMALDIDRNAVLDSCQDCDDDGIPDLIALDGANDIWAISSRDERIKEYHSATGVLMRQSEPGYLDRPMDLVITPDARILVTSANDDRVVEFDRSGAFVRDLVSEGAGGLDEPGAMLLADGSALLLASTASNSVLRFDVESGRFEAELVRAGDGGLVGPFGLAFEPGGNLLVTSSDGRVLEYHGLTGVFVRVFVDRRNNGGLANPRGIIVAPDGRVVVASERTDELLAFDALTGRFEGAYQNGDYQGKLIGPWGLRVGPDRNVYVSASLSGELVHDGWLHLLEPRILMYDGANGNLLFPHVQALDSELIGPTGFDFMPAGGDCNRNLIPDICENAP